MRWDRLLKDIADSFYLMPLMLILAALVFLYGIIKKKYLGNQKWLIFQAIATLSQGVLNVILYKDSLYRMDASWRTIQAIGEISYLLLELVFCTFFIVTNIKKKLFKKIIYLYTGSVLLILPVIFFSHPINENSSIILFAIENICLTASCLLFINDLFKQPPTRHLTREPSFWAISGMLLLFTTGTPLFLLFNKLDYDFAINTVYLINYILYCILYLTYLKAIQCSPAQPIS